MNRIDKLHEQHNRQLENECQKNEVSFLSLQKLLEIERTKKFLRRNAMIQQFIDREIDNSVENENK